MTTDDLRTIRVDEFLSHPPEKVWRALTEPELIARWLMPAPSDPSGLDSVGTFTLSPEGTGCSSNMTASTLTTRISSRAAG